jgi:tetratricopeptide (TPR) repeat protein
MDVSIFVLEFASSGKRGLLHMAKRGYEMIILSRPELTSQPVDVFLEALGDSLFELYDSLGDGVVLETTIVIYQEILRLRPQGHQRRLISLLDLGVSLQRSFAEQIADAALLNQLIGLFREAAELSISGGPAHRRALGSLSKALFSLYKHSHSVEVLVEGMDISRVLLSLPVHPFEYPGRFVTMNRLSASLLLCFKHQDDMDWLAEAIDLGRRALELSPLEHHDRLVVLNNLASALHHRSMRLGCLGSLVEAVDLYNQALILCHPGHPYRFCSLNLLGDAMLSGFERLGNLDSLAWAVNMYRQALDMLPLGHRHCFRSLNSLASALNTQYEQLGSLDVLEEMVRLYRLALTLRPSEHPDRSDSLSKLADTLFITFQRLGDGNALAEAITLYRQTLHLRPFGDPDHSSILNTLADALHVQFQQDGDSYTLMEAVDLRRQTRNYSPIRPHVIHPEIGGAHVTENPDISRLMQEFSSSGKSGVYDMVMRVYEMATSSRSGGDATLAKESADDLWESLGDMISKLYDFSQDPRLLKMGDQCL